MIQAFVFDFSHKLFGMVIHNRSSGSYHFRQNSNLREIPINLLGITTVSIPDKKSGIRAKRTVRICPGFEYLHQPFGGRMRRNSTYENSLCFQMDKKENIISYKPIFRPDRNGKKSPAQVIFSKRARKSFHGSPRTFFFPSQNLILYKISYTRKAGTFGKYFLISKKT